MSAIGTPIPKCKHCGDDAMPNTEECNFHWIVRMCRDDLPEVLADVMAARNEAHTLVIDLAREQAS